MSSFVERRTTWCSYTCITGYYRRFGRTKANVSSATLRLSGEEYYSLIRSVRSSSGFAGGYYTFGGFSISGGEFRFNLLPASLSLYLSSCSISSSWGLEQQQQKKLKQLELFFFLFSFFSFYFSGSLGFCLSVGFTYLIFITILMIQFEKKIDQFWSQLWFRPAFYKKPWIKLPIMLFSGSMWKSPA